MVSSAGGKKRPASYFFGKRLLALGFGCVLVANSCDKGELPRASEHVGSNIRASRVIAEIFGEQFFVPVWSLNARLDRYLRNGECPN
jgi:hypothetical protein